MDTDTKYFLILFIFVLDKTVLCLRTLHYAFGPTLSSITLSQYVCADTYMTILNNNSPKSVKNLYKMTLNMGMGMSYVYMYVVWVLPAANITDMIRAGP